MSTTISIHRALALISKKEETLENSISENIFCGIVVGSSKRPLLEAMYRSEEELRQKIQSSTDAVEGSIKLIVKIKEAISRSNLETKVDFLGEQKSITELLALKVMYAQYSNYLARLRRQAQEVQNKIEVKNQAIEEEAKKQPNYTETLQQLMSIQGLFVITENPNLSVNQKIEKVEEKLLFLKHDLDTILSETNLSTLITIED